MTSFSVSCISFSYECVFFSRNFLAFSIFFCSQHSRKASVRKTLVWKKKERCWLAYNKNLKGKRVWENEKFLRDKWIFSLYFSDLKLFLLANSKGNFYVVFVGKKIIRQLTPNSRYGTRGKFNKEIFKNKTFFFIHSLHVLSGMNSLFFFVLSELDSHEKLNDIFLRAHSIRVCFFIKINIFYWFRKSITFSVEWIFNKTTPFSCWMKVISHIVSL